MKAHLLTCLTEVTGSLLASPRGRTTPLQHLERGLKANVPRREIWQRLKPLARSMREDPTAAEERLWTLIRNRQIANGKFRRQHSIGPFVVDFYCSRARLVIEVDGEIHKFQEEEDGARQEFLRSRGLHLLRFSNEEVLLDHEAVVNKIRSWLLRALSPSPDAGEGERG